MDKKRVTIVTLTYNHLDVSKEFIASLYQYTKEHTFDLIIVDNFSSDGTREYLHQLEQERSNVRVIYNSENLGYSKGNNIGIKAAKTEIIGLLNNDILLSPNWLENILMSFDEYSDAGLIAPTMLIDSDKTAGIKCKRNRYLTVGKANANSAFSLCHKELYPQFSCVFLKRSLTEEIGILDENFTPAFYEDDDYIIRVWRAGYSCYVCNKSFYFHNHSKTSSELPAYIAARNREYLIKKDFLAYEMCRTWNASLELEYIESRRLKNRCLKILKEIKNVIKECIGKKLGKADNPPIWLMAKLDADKYNGLWRRVYPSLRCLQLPRANRKKYLEYYNFYIQLPAEEAKGAIYKVFPHLEDMEFDKDEYVECAPSEYLVSDAYELLIDGEKRNSKDWILLDAGSGSGWVIYKSVELFKYCYGIEIDKTVYDLSLKNLAVSTCKTNYEIFNQNIDDIDEGLLDRVNVFYMYNPFHGETFERYIDKITSSLHRTNREGYIIYANAQHRDYIELQNCFRVLNEIKYENWSTVIYKYFQC